MEFKTLESQMKNINQIKSAFIENGCDFSAFEKLGEGVEAVVYGHENIAIKAFKHMETTPQNHNREVYLNRVAFERGINTAPIMDYLFAPKLTTFMPKVSGHDLFDDAKPIIPETENCVNRLVGLHPSAWQKFFADCIELHELGLDFEPYYKNFRISDQDLNTGEHEIFILDTHLNEKQGKLHKYSTEERESVLSSSLWPTIVNTAAQIRYVNGLDPSLVKSKLKGQFHEICSNAFAGVYKLGGKKLSLQIKQSSDLIQSL
jgi:hypothetical protein